MNERAYGSEILSQISSEHQRIEQVRSRVEEVLQMRFAQTSSDPGLLRVRGKLSTLPEVVDPDVRRALFVNRCDTFSLELADGLAQSGRMPQFATSNLTEEHVYLLAQEGSTEVVIDPTIGQFVEGHNHVFVGTRAQLRDVVFKQTRWEGPYKLVMDSWRGKGDFWRKKWGDTSAIAQREWFI